MNRLGLAILTLCAFAAPAAAQGGNDWTVPLRERIHKQLQEQRTVDVVVLVPDIETYFAALTQWSHDGGVWPILIEDDHYAPMFIRRFQPSVVLRVPSAKHLFPPDVRTPRALEDIIARFHGEDPEEISYIGHYEASGVPPLGVILSDANDPGVAAALPLAMMRRQVILWSTTARSDLNAVLGAEQMSLLHDELKAELDALPWAWDDLGDDIDAITIARTMGARYAKENASGNQTFALTDALGRHDNGDRFALAGQIVGDDVRCAYMAMCSLFLDRGRWSLTNTYPLDGAWRHYRMDELHEQLSKNDAIASQHMAGEDATLAAWRRSLRGGWTQDLIFVNTKGNVNWFHTSDQKQARWSDIPVLNTPAAVHFIHSWSAAAPGAPGTIAESWLSHGAYAYIGSCHEPTLGAFLPPDEVARRLGAGLPLLMAGRHLSGAGARTPWKVVTFGDPLMTIFQPAGRDRMAPADANSMLLDVAVSVREELQRTLTSLKTTPTMQGYADAMRDAVLLDNPVHTGAVWRLAVESDMADLAAPFALADAFRMGSVERMLQALEYTVPQTDVQRDMVWHLLSSRLEGRADEQLVMALESAIRPPRLEEDVATLIPHATRVFSREHARNMVSRALNRATTKGAREGLQKLLGGL